MSDHPPLTERDLQEVAALADGSLDAARADALRARMEREPQLAAELATQERAIRRIVAAQRQVGAPAELRRRVADERLRRRPLFRGARLGFAAGGLAVVAAAVAVLFLVLPGSLSGDEVIARAAASHAKPAQGPAPSARTDTLLDFERFGVTFPSWSKKFQWDATGVRSDRIGGRDVATVLYRKEGREVGYSVIAGDRIAPPARAETVVQEGTRILLYEQDGRTIAVFERSGHTCVMSGTDVPRDKLVELAGWKGKGTVPFG